MQNDRREFLKKAGVVGAAAVATATTVAASNIKSGKSKKTEVLYQRSKNWELYYQQAK